MKYLIRVAVIVYLCFMCIHVTAQKKDENKPQQNVVKINLSALAFKNISLQYERAVGKRTSVAMNVRTIPMGSLAFQSVIDNIVDQAFIEYDQIKVGGFGIVPEFRYYLGKKDVLQGFYIGTFVSYNNYTMSLPISYSNNTRTGIFDGKLNAVTGGLQLGAQFRLSNSLTLDWWIIGPNYGAGNGTLNLSTALSPSEQSELKNQLENLKNEVPLNIIKSYSVSSTGATINAKGPWGGLRGLGFNLGLRF